MAPDCTRRSFIEKAALGTAAYGFMPLPGLQSPPAMAITTYGSPEESDEAIREEAIRLTTRAIADLGGMERFIDRNDTVFIKPNIGWDRLPAQAACTNPDVVATLVKLCYDAGAKRVKVSDYPCNDQRRTFLRSGIQAAAEAEGAEVFFMDRRKFREMDLGGENLRRWSIYTDYVECDKRINVPIAKHHGLTGLTLTIKNLMGVIGGERNRIHQNLGPAMADVAKFVPSDLVVLDAVRVLMANGPTGGSLSDVQRRDTIVAGTDTVAVEAFGASLFGIAPDRTTTTTAGAALGLGTIDYESLDPVRSEV